MPEAETWRYRGQTIDREEIAFLREFMTVAPENGAIMAGRKGPAMWLRYGRLPAHRRQI